jgi:hypothetical protein
MHRAKFIRGYNQEAIGILSELSGLSAFQIARVKAIELVTQVCSRRASVMLLVSRLSALSNSVCATVKIIMISILDLKKVPGPYLRGAALMIGLPSSTSTLKATSGQLYLVLMAAACLARAT